MDPGAGARRAAGVGVGHAVEAADRAVLPGAVAPLAGGDGHHKEQDENAKHFYVLQLTAGKNGVTVEKDLLLIFILFDLMIE